MSNGQDSTIQYSLVSTALGWVGVLVSPKGIRCLGLPQPTPDMTLQYLQWSKPVDLVEATAGSFPNIERRLEQYFGGEETTFDDSLDLVGTAFQKKVWEVARTIPWGETRSYGWIARSMGNPGASRAVGQAMRSNPVPIIVPCHRVIGSDGSMCGYGGPDGVDLKLKFLAIEQDGKQ
ncbi:MAG: methylated-DNA--[protein]-cysteine S-methyltransferase [Dehalococcoidia bacterium]|nr:methylated-DNA--[protein]-cysteine S-methyltransferase [Dehalococcoidia bacterium]